MNANYQRISIAAIFILLIVVVAAVLLPSSEDEVSTEKSVGAASASASTDFAPFESTESASDISSTSSTSTAHELPPEAAPQASAPAQQSAARLEIPHRIKETSAEIIKKTERFSESLPEDPQENPWAARISPEEEARIDAIIDAAEARQREQFLKHADRRAAIERADQVTELCFEEIFTRAPDVSGHVIVNFYAVGDGQGRGTFEDVRIVINHNLRDMAFESCIVAAIQSAQFAAESADRIWVEHALSTDPLP